MKHITTLVFLVATYISCSASSLKIATYNVGNYNATNRMTDDGYKLDYPKPEAAKHALRSVIQSLDADVIVMQEMGTLPYLEELQRDLKNMGTPYPHRHLVLAHDASRHLAVLSRIAWSKITSHVDIDFKYFGGKEHIKRGLLEIVFETPSGAITVWGVHLKSRFTDRPDDPASNIKRAGEAVAIRDTIIRNHPNHSASRFILLGDFNDVRGARPLRACQNKGQTSIAELLPARDSRGESWTRFHAKDDSYERVDFILCSPGLTANVQGRRATICDAPATSVASDHRPVSVILEWK